MVTQVDRISGKPELPETITVVGTVMFVAGIGFLTSYFLATREVVGSFVFLLGLLFAFLAIIELLDENYTSATGSMFCAAGLFFIAAMFLVRVGFPAREIAAAVSAVLSAAFLLLTIRTSRISFPRPLPLGMDS